MQLTSYYNAATRLVAIQLASDAAMAAPWEVLGEIDHTLDDDNLSGAQRTSISHAIYSHVQEQLYVKFGVQDLQRISITYAGGFVPVAQFWVETGARVVRPEQTIKVKAHVVPANATVDDYYVQAANPGLVEIVPGETPGEFTVGFTGQGETTVWVGVRNSDLRQQFAFACYDRGLVPTIDNGVEVPVVEWGSEYAIGKGAAEGALQKFTISPALPTVAEVYATLRYTQAPGSDDLADVPVTINGVSEMSVTIDEGASITGYVVTLYLPNGDSYTYTEVYP